MNKNMQKLATAKTLDRLVKYINEYWYSTNYTVDPDTLEIRNPLRAAPPAGYVVQPYRGGFLFGRVTP